MRDRDASTSPHRTAPTVQRAYQEIEHAGLVASRPGFGTFVTAALSKCALAGQGPPRRPDPESIEAVLRDAPRASAVVIPPVASGGQLDGHLR